MHTAIIWTILQAEEENKTAVRKSIPELKAGSSVRRSTCTLQTVYMQTTRVCMDHIFP